jgi:hypothetical protein
MKQPPHPFAHVEAMAEASIAEQERSYAQTDGQ